MGYKKLQAGEITFLKPNEMEEGQTIEGRYTEVRKDQFGGNGHKIVNTHGTFVLNGTSQLDALLALCPLGSNVKVTYKGTIKLKTGKFKGKDAHQFDVFLSDDDGANAAAEL